jgi:hypothetical protein
MLAVAYATGRASHARQVKGDDPDKKGYPGPPSWGFGLGLTTPHSKKLIVTKVDTTGQSPQRAVVPVEKKKKKKKKYELSRYMLSSYIVIKVNDNIIEINY